VFPITAALPDAAEQSGAGIKPTFPADTRLSPFLAIDHILTRDCTATSLHTLTLPGSDHRGPRRDRDDPTVTGESLICLGGGGILLTRGCNDQQP
jgi:hypothetical protein